MPAAQTGLNLLSPGFLTSVPCKNLPTSRAGIRKLNPCVSAPDDESDTNCITPTSVASSVMAGPPLLPWAAGASVWMRSWLMTSTLNPDTAPLVAEASRVDALVQELVGEHDPGKAEDVHRVADLHLAGGEADRGIDAVLHPQECEVAPGVGRRLASAVDARRRAEFLDLGLQLDAARQHHGDLGLRLELGAGEGARGGQAEPLLDVGLLPVHEPPGLQLRLDARLIDRLLLQLVRHPRREPVGRIDDVGVGDDVPAAVDEPAGARLDERSGADGDRAAAAVQRDVAAHLGSDQHDGRLDTQDRFLDGVRRDATGSSEPGTREEEPEHQGSHALGTVSRSARGVQ